MIYCVKSVYMSCRFIDWLVNLKVVDPICSLKMWDWIKIMACRNKYHVGTLLKDYEPENNFRLTYYEKIAEIELK